MELDVIVIGGGQAGLATGFYLKRLNNRFVILDEQARSGDVWRNRYDSLTLFTPRFYSSMPGLHLKGDPNGYPTKNEIADYLVDYATYFELPIIHGQKVKRLSKEGKQFIVTTEKEDTYRAKQVVIATGAFHTPFVPTISELANNEVYQIHASTYKNPTQIPAGNVLVVGAGNTGVQIAAELSETHQVTLSCSKRLKTLPQTILGQNLFFWFEWLGLNRVNANSFISRWLKKHDPIIGDDFKKVKANVEVVSRLVDIKENKAVFLEGKQIKLQSIIWATGYRNCYKWIEVNGVLDSTGNPNHKEGITNVAGLFFIGLSWQRKRGSALLHGVGEDAEFIVERVIK